MQQRKNSPTETGMVHFKSIFHAELDDYRIVFEYLDDLKGRNFCLIEDAVKFCTPRRMFGLVDRLARRSSLVQTPPKGAKISPFQVI